MKKFASLLVGCTALAGAWLVQAVEQPWELAKEQEGIKVYLQKIEGSKYKAYRGVVSIKAPLERLRAMQEDVGAACSWIYNCKLQKLLKTDGADTWFYARFDTPWPVQSRDAVFKTTTEAEPDGVVVRKLQALPEYLPPEKGYARVQGGQGFWRMTPKEGHVEVEYQMHTDPGGSVPGWLANSFVVDAPYNTLLMLRAKAEKP